VLVDDLDGGAAEVTVAFAINGESYSLDLSAPNAERFWKLLEPYIDAGKKSRKGSIRGGTNTGSAAIQQRAEIRDWARKNGIDIAPRGRIPQDVIDAYQSGQKP